MPKLYGKSKIDKGRIAAALAELEAIRNQKFSVESIAAWILEFENIGFTTEQAVKRIKIAKYMQSYNTTEFSHFLDLRNDEIVPNDVVYIRALNIIKSRDIDFMKVVKRVWGEAYELPEEETYNSVMDKMTEYLNKAAESRDVAVLIKHQETQEEKLSNLIETNEKFTGRIKKKLSDLFEKYPILKIYKNDFKDIYE